MDTLIKKFYSSGLNSQKPTYETRTNFFANNTNLTNYNYLAMNNIKTSQPMYHSANDLSSITEKVMNSSKFNLKDEKDPVLKLTLMEEKLKSLENNALNKENTKSLLNMIQNNIMEQQQKTIQYINEQQQSRVKSWYVSKTPKQNKLSKFKKVKEKFYESDYPDETIEVLAELHDNMEDFKEDLKFQLKGIQKESNRNNVEEIAREIEKYKKDYKKHIDERKGGNLGEINILMSKLEEFKSDLKKEIEENTAKNNLTFSKLNDEILDFRKHCNEKIDALETKQNSHLESVKLFLDRTDRRSSLVNNFAALKQDANYARPKKSEIEMMRNHLRKRSSMRQEDIENFIVKKKSLNNDLGEEMLEEEKVNPKHLRKNSIYKQNKKLAKRNKMVVNLHLKKLNVLRSWVYAIIATKVIREQKVSKLDSLKEFVGKFDEMDLLLNQFVFNSVKNVYTSIVSFTDLKLDISESGSFFNSSEAELKTKFIKLETRLDGFIDALKENTKKNKLKPHLKEYLQLIISEGKFIPRDFFTCFERNRLDFNEAEENQQKMILAVYIICKILVYNILTLNKFSTGLVNNIAKKNFKIIASIFYKTVINSLIDKVSIVEKLEEDQIEEVREFTPLEITKKVKDEGFITAWNEYKEKKFRKDKETETKLLSVFKAKQGKSGQDNLINEIAYISGNLFGDSELTSYFKLANKFGYDLSSKIDQWLDDLLTVIKE